MLMLGLHLLLGGASCACGLAAVGLVLYGHGPWALSAGQLFAGFGFAVGLLGGALHQWLNQRQHLQPAALPPEALAGLVRATVASLSASRSVAARTAPAGAAPAPIMAPERASGPVPDALATAVAVAAVPAPAPRLEPALASAITARARAVATAGSGLPRQFANSAFGT